MSLVHASVPQRVIEMSCELVSCGDASCPLFEILAALRQFIKFSLKTWGIMPRSQKDVRVVRYYDQFFSSLNILYRFAPLVILVAVC